MHWVYILSLDGDRIYVGETTRLIRRLSEHTMKHKHGSISTDIFKVNKLLGLYKIDNNIDYYSVITRQIFNHLDIENIITENTMRYTGDKWWKVRGGKHTKILYDNIQKCECKDYNNCSECYFYKFTKDEMIKLRLIKNASSNLQYKYNPPYLEESLKRPKCYCNIPSEIKFSNNKCCWVCPMRGNYWIYDYLYFDLDVNNGCNFYITA